MESSKIEMKHLENIISIQYLVPYCWIYLWPLSLSISFSSSLSFYWNLYGFYSYKLLIDTNSLADEHLHNVLISFLTCKLEEDLNKDMIPLLISTKIISLSPWNQIFLFYLKKKCLVIPIGTMLQKKPHDLCLFFFHCLE